MKTFFRILLALVLLVALALGGFYLYTRYFAQSEGQRSPFSIMPKEVIFVVETNDLSEAWTTISDSRVWHHLMSAPDFEEINGYMVEVDALLKDNAPIRLLLADRDIFLAAQMVPGNDYDFIFVVDLKGTAAVSNLLTEAIGLAPYEVRHTEHQGQAVIELVDPEDPEFVIYLSIIDNLLVGSFQRQHLQNCIDIKDQQYWDKNEKFQSVKAELSGNKLFSFYFNFKLFGDFYKVFMEEESEMATMLEGSLAYSALDFFLVEDRMSFTGFTNLDSIPSYINAVLETSPSEPRAYRILPDHTALYFSMCFSDYYALQKRLVEQFASEAGAEEVEGYDKSLQRAERLLGLSLDEAFFRWFGNEFAFVKLQPSADTRMEDVLAYIHANDIDLAKESLDELLQHIRRRSPLRFESELYQNHEINYLNTEKGLFMLLFGKLFKDMDKPYFTYIDEFVVFSNSANSLKQAIDAYVLGKFLRNNENFDSFRNEFSAKANITLFIQMTKMYENMLHYSAPEDRAEMQANKELLLSFARVGFQLTNQNNLIATAFIADHDTLAFLEEQLEIIQGDATERLFNAEFDSLAFKILPDMLVEDRGEQTLTRPGGSRLAEGRANRGEPDGLWRSYYPSGNLYASVNYQDGKISGMATFFYDSPENPRKAELNFEDDVIQGIYREFFENGARKVEIEYKDGRFDGDAQFFHMSGSVQITGQYKEGLKDGRWEYFDERGERIGRERWRDGQRRRE